MMDQGRCGILLRKDPLSKALPIDLLIDMETVALHDTIMAHLLKDEPSLIKGHISDNPQQNNTVKAFRSGKNKEVVLMGSGSMMHASLVLQGRTLEDLRKEHHKGLDIGASLFSIDFGMFAPSKTPESRARIGVLMVQVASFMRSTVTASLVPQRFGGEISEKDLPEPVRLEMLRTMAGQGFKWMEIESDIPPDQIIELVTLANRSGTNVMITARVGNDRTDLGFDPDLLDLVNGLKLKVDMGSPSMVRSLPSILGTAVEAAKERTLVISPFGRSSSLAMMVLEGWTGRSVLLEVRPVQMDGPLVPIQDDILRFRSLMGRTFENEGSDVGRSVKAIGRNTGLFFLLGGLKTTGFKLKMMNDAFHLIGEDKVMLPWETRPDGLKETLGMMREAGAQGMVIEPPFRTGAVPFMDWVDPRSRTVGSIDLVIGKGKQLYGYNTELYAISDLIKKASMKKGMRCLVFGTGATGRSAAVASSMMGLETMMVGGNLERTRGLASSLGNDIKGITPKGLKRPGLKFDVVIGTVQLDQLNEPGISDNIDLIEAVKGFSPKVGLDTTVLKGWSPLLSAVESAGGSTLKGSDLLSRSILRGLSIWMDRSLDQEGLEELVRNSIV